MLRVFMINALLLQNTAVKGKTTTPSPPHKKFLMPVYMHFKFVKTMKASLFYKTGR